MPLNRRDLFRGIALALAASPVLAACGGAPAPGGVPLAGGNQATPRRGGALRAVFGGGPAESLDPYAVGTPVDFVRNDVVYDSLFVLRGAESVPSLATAVEVAKDAKSFTLRLRENVRWHDGSPFTAQDVVYSLRYMCSPDRPFPSQLAPYLDVARANAIDAKTVVVPTLTPVGDPAQLLAAIPAKMVKDGAKDFSAGKAIGTGPYRVDSFEAGRQTRLVRFDGHWDGQAPADEILLLSLSDPQTAVRAVTSGQADYAGDVPVATARTGVPGADLEIRTAGEANRIGFAFVLNTTRKPFDDPRVRRAVRLAVNRQALVDTVLLGYGAPGNDLFGKGARHHSDTPPPARDVAAARKLIKEAGAEGAAVTLRSAEYVLGYNASTQLFAEQLKEIGLDARVQLVGLQEFFEPAALAEANSVTFSIGPSPLAATYGRLGAFPSLALADPEFTAAFQRALGATEDSVRAQAWEQAQRVMAERGNTVVWGQADVLSVARKTVAGVQVRDEAKYPYLGKAGLA
ncbi:ABC transporter substrate-binding protein [Crossiella sp. CA198]|uniref:ABC transporter substrate-binding protein n=1 Tax=Crossiella sp. CA198 TaxID=3455607 RepID=UPI003F8D28CB